MVTALVGETGTVVIREFDAGRDCPGAEAVERMCEVGSTGGGGGGGKIALFTDLMGDPICRVRHSPSFLMLVAETGAGAAKEIVGLIRGCVKAATCGKKKTASNGKPPAAACTRLGYILGLRVSPLHRRMGIGLRLVTRMEEWFREKGAEYTYMATEKDNAASISLFTGKCRYSKFRTPSILVHPVFAHRLRAPRRAAILRLSPADAETLYRHRMSTVEFFPRDIDAVLNNPLSLGTFLAVVERGPGTTAASAAAAWAGAEAFLADPPESWAVLSVWNCKDVYRLELRGASRMGRWLASVSRAFDRAFPWLGIPSVPDLFRPFGFYFLYGLGGEGAGSAGLLRSLCVHAHNLAREGGCAVVAAEVASCEPLRAGVPHWKWLSLAEDVWCMKRLGEEDDGDGSEGDWTKSPPEPSIFVDPREI